MNEQPHSEEVIAYEDKKGSSMLQPVEHDATSVPPVRSSEG
jgi:hypothetical protein